MIVNVSRPQAVPGISEITSPRQASSLRAAMTTATGGSFVTAVILVRPLPHRVLPRARPGVHRRCRALVAAAASTDLRPHGVADLGPRDRRRLAEHRGGPVLEAAARAVHDAVL